jgi:hypothetical protein
LKVDASTDLTSTLLKIDVSTGLISVEADDDIYLGQHQVTVMVTSST